MPFRDQPSQMKPKILVFCDFYLPGFKSGGGMWTVVNLVDRFCDRYDFFIVTRNYDSRDDKVPYTSVRTGEWNIVGNARVYYASNALINQNNFLKIIRYVDPAAVFLNSVFCTLSVKFLLLRRRKGLKEIPVVLAPCGEVSKPSLSLKPLKKKTFLRTARISGLFQGVIWKGSADIEHDEIKTIAGKRARVLIAPDLPPKQILPVLDLAQKPRKMSGSLTLSFVSRLVRKKNLHFLLEALLPIRKGKVELDLVGPLEDDDYWYECKAIIDKLPANVNVRIVGGVSNDQVLKNLIGAHFFVLPTLNENFGYVFVEAMAAGCPLLISDRTIWNNLEEKGLGWNVSLDSVEKWTWLIERCVSMDHADYQRMSVKARNFAIEWLADQELENATARVLEAAINDKRRPNGN